MGQDKSIFWNEKIKPFLNNKQDWEKIIKRRLEKIFLSDRQRTYAKEKIRIGKKVGAVLRRFPTIVFVGITGSVSSDWPREKDDIDFLIVCRRNRLWLSRIVVTVVLKLAGFELRKNSQERRNSLCLNMWLEESSLTIEKSRQNILTALDLVWIKPVVNKRHCWQNFLLANEWAKKYVKIPINSFKNNNNRNKTSTGSLWQKTINVVNLLAFWAQYLYMKRKIRREIICLNKAYFHPNGKIRFDRI